MCAVVGGQEYQRRPFLLFALVPQGNTPLVEQGASLSLSLSPSLSLSLSLSVITQAHAHCTEDMLVRAHVITCKRSFFTCIHTKTCRSFLPNLEDEYRYEFLYA